MGIHKSENTYNFSGIFTNINKRMLKVITYNHIYMKENL